MFKGYKSRQIALSSENTHPMQGRDTESEHSLRTGAFKKPENLLSFVVVCELTAGLSCRHPVLLAALILHRKAMSKVVTLPCVPFFANNYDHVLAGSRSYTTSPLVPRQ